MVAWKCVGICAMRILGLQINSYYCTYIALVHLSTNTHMLHAVSYEMCALCYRMFGVIDPT